VSSEPDDQHLHSVRCCDHRENPSIRPRVSPYGSRRRRSGVRGWVIRRVAEATPEADMKIIIIIVVVLVVIFLATRLMRKR